eukprot:14763363-Heterocapsa_arctica.AAC.1
MLRRRQDGLAILVADLDVELWPVPFVLGHEVQDARELLHVVLHEDLAQLREEPLEDSVGVLRRDVVEVLRESAPELAGEVVRNLTMPFVEDAVQSLGAQDLLELLLVVPERM